MGKLTDYDIAAAEICSMEYADGTPQVFQFPPKVTSDDATLEWNSTAGSQYSGEFLMPKSIKNRTLRLEWSYMPGFGGWTISDVQTYVRLFRGYVYLAAVNNAKNNGRGMYDYIVSFKYPGITGADSESMAMSAMSVKYSDTMYVTNNIVYPTKIDCSCELKLWYNAQASGALAAAGKDQKPDPKNPNQQPAAKDDGGLGISTIKVDWY